MRNYKYEIERLSNESMELRSEIDTLRCRAGYLLRTYNAIRENENLMEILDIDQIGSLLNDYKETSLAADKLVIRKYDIDKKIKMLKRCTLALNDYEFYSKCGIDISQILENNYLENEGIVILTSF